MTPTSPWRPPAGAALLVLVLLVPACLGNGDSPVTPVAGRVTLDSLWPYRDGLGWTYRLVQRSLAWDGGGAYYDTAAEVPPAPDMEEIVRRLANPHGGAVAWTDTATFILRFRGAITTGSGVTAAHLTETLITDGGIRTPARGGRFLDRLAAARPDLRAALRGRFAAAAAADTFDRGITLFLYGYAWEKTADWIGMYGDVDQELAWKFLTARLSPGSEFTHQLVPALASDVFLHGRIMARGTVSTPAGLYANAVSCAYLVDYGLATAVDQGGNPVGCFRVYDYGSVTYVKDVGPVACYERRGLYAGGSATGDRENILTLTATDWSPALAAHAARSR